MLCRKVSVVSEALNGTRQQLSTDSSEADKTMLEEWMQKVDEEKTQAVDPRDLRSWFGAKGDKQLPATAKASRIAAPWVCSVCTYANLPNSVGYVKIYFAVPSSQRH
jgi:ABC-type phosphate transport system substrate-binding protein